MKNKYFTLLILLGFALPWQKVKAQDYLSIQYSISFPANDLHDYIPKTSFRGVTVEYITKLSSTIGAGVSVGWNGFYERRNYATYQRGTESLSGIQYRYSDAAPIHINALYLFRPEKRWTPYAAMGIGTIFTNRVTDMGLYRRDEDTWSFSIKPEAGIILNLSDYLQSKLSIRYNEAFQTSEMQDQSFLSVNIGLASRQ